MKSSKVDLTIVTPCFNEVATIEQCIKSVSEIMYLNLSNIKYEHIISDNCSKDGTIDVLIELRSKYKNLRVLVNSRNVGPVNNIWSALHRAKGDTIIPFLPADLQDPAEMIPVLYNEIVSTPELDTVFGVRKTRAESFILKSSRSVYYKLIRRFSNLQLPEHAGEFLITKREIINKILETEQVYPYIRGLIAQSSDNSKVVEYHWQRRKAGISKNNFWSLLDEAINGFVSVSKVPARLGIIFGVFISLLGFFFAILNIVLSFFVESNTAKGIPTIIVGLFTLGGIQLAFLGLLGEYILSIHTQVKKAPLHIVKEL